MATHPADPHRLGDALARVRFRGKEPTPAQASATADYAGAPFAADGATTFYAYHTMPISPAP